MNKAVIGALSGAAILLSGLSANAQSYTDSNRIGYWAEPYVEFLTKVGCFKGYPNGEFRPQSNITRQELAVVVAKCLDTVHIAVDGTEQDIKELRADLAELESRLSAQEQLTQEQAETLAAAESESNRKRDNHVGIGFAYGFDGPGAVAIEGKLRVLNLNDTFGVSLRPGVNTAKETYLAATVDIDATKDLTLYGGVGAALSFNSDFTGLLTSGRDGDVTPYAQVGAELDLTRTVGIFTDVKVPLEEDTFSDVVGTVGLFVSF